MIQSDYALSYNVKNSAIKVLKRACYYNTWSDIDSFICWFNKRVENRGRIVMSDICNRLGEKPIEAYDRIGFNSLLTEDNIYEIKKPDNTVIYRLLFPVLKDFTKILDLEDY